MIAIRYLSAASIGLLVTTSLLYLMQLLVDSGPGVVEAATLRHRIDWVRLIPEETLVIDEQHPERLPPPEPTPPDPRHMLDGPGTGTAMPPVDPPAPPTGGPGIGSAWFDDPLVPVVIVAPEYPLRATAQGLAGHVTVRYDVTATGTVANVVVLESSHKVFEAAATKAAYRFRYKPRVVDAVAQETRDLRYRFVFRMED
ncbi:MAG: energy transducer TonB [Woeseiaceae bacterium]|nr:energy transducer TonB [Woeseiaceae bacterium]